MATKDWKRTSKNQEFTSWSNKSQTSNITVFNKRIDGQILVWVNHVGGSQNRKFFNKKGQATKWALQYRKLHN